MLQTDPDRIAKRLFFFRGTYIYIIIAISTLIALTSRDVGPFASAALDRVWFWAALLIASAGAMVRVITSGFAALGTSGRAKSAPEAAELNTTGPYSLVRNPLYVGRILNFTGLAMLSGSAVYAAVICLLAIFVYSRISSFEAAFLRSKFGDAHAKWAAEVPALLPRLSGWVKPKYPFWWKRMIWREQNKLFLLATAVFLVWFARHGFDFSQLALGQRNWVYAYGALFIVRLFISGLKMSGYFKELR
ncbi:MAG: isoprenylcysteine carboxylmethyltransferase family protein [Pseudomonadota bacterium]